jgi:hypothetical protein
VCFELVKPAPIDIRPVQAATKRAEEAAASRREDPTTILPIVMTTSDAPVPGNRDDEPRDRVGQLRGAGVEVDSRRIGRVAVGILLATLAILAVVFTVVAVHTNNQDDRLHNDGVPVTFTVTGCLGLLGGSGSNAAGYSCRGTYSLEGHSYNEPLPGVAFHRPGSTVAAIAVPGDAALVSPASIVATEHSSAGAYVLPVILWVLLLLLVVLLLVLRRWRKATASADGPPAP